MEKTMERMIANIKTTSSTPYKQTDVSVIRNPTLDSTSDTTENPLIITPWQPHPQKNDESLFSLPKVKLPTFEGIDARG